LLPGQPDPCKPSMLVADPKRTEASRVAAMMSRVSMRRLAMMERIRGFWVEPTAKASYHEDQPNSKATYRTGPDDAPG
jgi:hypothetical protein